MEQIQDKVYWEEMLASESSLFPLILKFNFNLAPSLENEDGLECSPSLKAWFGKLPDSWRKPASKELAKSFFWDFKEDSRKLALLEDDKLIQLAKITGVALEAHNLAKVVIREERANLVEALGADLFNYALMRGQYQVGEALRIFKQKNLNLPLLKRCKLEGWLALKLCALAWPLELQQLFLERLKRLFKEEDLNLTISLKANDRNILWNLLKKCLLREVDPSWTQYFTS